MLMNLDLQLFADDVDDDDNGTSEGEAELFAAIRNLAKEDSEDNSLEDDEADDEELTDDDEESDDDEEESDDSIEDEEDDLDEEEDDDEEEDEEPQGQSKEDNAKFAARRRQQELEARVQEQLKSSPEYKIAQKLAKQFGKPIDQILTELDDADIQSEAEQRQVTPEQVRKERERDERADRLEQENNQLKFQYWQTQIQLDTSKLLTDYPMLTQVDMDKAVDYILNVAKNVELPLEDAMFAVHGKKITKAMAKQTVQDDLATQSGRKRKTPLVPNNSKSSQSKSLSADEQYIARQFGMTDDEYRKFQ
jgi:hypothetical protein